LKNCFIDKFHLLLFAKKNCKLPATIFMRTIFFLFTFLFCSIAAWPQNNRFVRLSQDHLIDSSGQAVQLNGVNLGGWLLWEGWIWGAGFIKETKLKERLEDIAGKEATNDFIQKYYKTYIGEADIHAIAQLGYNCVRVPFNYRIFDTANNAAAPGFVVLDSVIGWCKKNRIYVVLDLHAAPGGQNSAFISDHENTKLWQSDEKREETVRLWTAIAARYVNEKAVAGYDLLNEPDFPKTELLLSFYEAISKGIRSKDKDHLLMLEGNDFAHNFKNFSLPSDVNTIYSFHYYPWFAENNKQKELNKSVDGATGILPLWCGEWGEDEIRNLKEIKPMLAKVPGYCGNAFWTWKKVYQDNNKYPICRIIAPGTWKKLMTAITWRLGKPSKEAAIQAMNDFLKAAAFENCRINENLSFK
jgi:hypothetical protein